MINYPHAYFLRLFLHKNINVLIWNYRGYGRSHKNGCFGNFPTPENIREDADCVYDYLRNVMGITGKIGVYGRSMGGIATCHLASKVDMAIVDRSFANLEEVIDSKFFGAPAVALYKVATAGWNSDNVGGYLYGMQD
jgi:dipeptidyl aminopeptidase/acylaminoacyl peptidase